MRIKFGIRTLLLVTLLCSTLVALLTTLANRGNTQIAAAQSLQQLGVSTYESNQSVEIQILSISNANGAKQAIGMPVVSVNKDRFDFARRLCGNSFFVKHNSLVFNHQISGDIDEIVADLEKLPYVRDVQFYYNTVSEIELQKLQSRFPEINFRSIDAINPQAVSSQLAPASKGG